MFDYSMNNFLRHEFGRSLRSLQEMLMEVFWELDKDGDEHVGNMETSRMKGVCSCSELRGTILSPP